jgi:hypothetical protein
MRVTPWQNAHRTLEPDPGGGATRPMPQWPHHDVAAVSPLAMPTGLVLPMRMKLPSSSSLTRTVLF